MFALLLKDSYMADMLVQLKNCASQLDRDRFEPVVGALLVGERFGIIREKENNLYKAVPHNILYEANLF